MFGTVLNVISIALVGVGGLVGYLFATDQAVEATVTDKDCILGEIAVKTKTFSIDHKVKEVPKQECAIIQVGNFVQYRLRTERTTIYASEGGACLYDSKTVTC